MELGASYFDKIPINICVCVRPEHRKQQKSDTGNKDVYQCTSTQSKITISLQPAMSLHFCKPTQQRYRNV